MKKCTYCGKEAPDDATVCPLDGEPVVDPAAPPKQEIVFVEETPRSKSFEATVEEAVKKYKSGEIEGDRIVRRTTDGEYSWTSVAELSKNERDEPTPQKSVTKTEQISADAPPRLQPSQSPQSSRSENILGVIVGIIGALILTVCTLSCAIVEVRPANTGGLVLGLVTFILGIRMAQKKDRAYFFTMKSLAVFGLVVCTSFAGYFLLKGENWPYRSITTKDGTINYYDISAYSYWFVWSQTERNNENIFETDLYNELWQIHDTKTGESIATAVLGADTSRPKSLSDKEGFNITIAIFGAMAALSFSLLPFLRRFMTKAVSKTSLEPNPAVPPVLEAPDNPKISDSPTSDSGGGGSA